MTDDNTIRDLNRKFLGRDSRTDVIAFGYNDDGIPLMGDVIIDLKSAELQKGSASLEEELQILFLHGCLHILGYDHLGKSREDIMLERENRYLEIIRERNTNL